MDFNNIIKLMDQQLKALKEIEELLAHNDEQTPTHSINPEDIEGLKNYITTMKKAANTATALANHFENKRGTQPAKTPQANEATTTPDGESEKAEKPKRSSAKKQNAVKEEPFTEPAVEEEEDLDFLL